MKTVFNTGPGFYAAASKKSDENIPKGIMRFYICRLEAYDGKINSNDKIEMETVYEILFSKADGNPKVAKALLLLGDAIQSNIELLKEEAAK